jgi:DNA-binding PucR family transcriptional regulator
VNADDVSEEVSTILVHTLQAYRSVEGDFAAAAAALHIHRSTLRYRLYRIRQLTGLGPDDPESLTVLRRVISGDQGRR